MDEQAPVLRVVDGSPTAEELAALVTVLAGRARARAGARPVSTGSQWVRNSRPGATVGALPVHRGPDAWRSSALPR